MNFPENLSEKDKYLSLGTFKKNGTIVRTPVWFTYNENKLYIFTAKNSWKVKRLRNNKEVEFASCNSSGRNMGDIAKGTAEIIEDHDLFKQYTRFFKKKYGFMFAMFNFMGKLRRTDHVFLEIYY